MKKLFVITLFSTLCLSAAAQREIVNSRWDMGGSAAISYNLVSNAPQNMSPHGLGLDFCLFQIEYRPAAHTALSLGLLDLMLDFRYLQKGYVFENLITGLGSSNSNVVIVRANEDARAKGNMTDFTFAFPLGITQRLAPRWSVSAYVIPGIGLVSYNTNYIFGGIHHKDRFYPTSGRAGFRLDVKAVVWFEDLGLFFRYRPIGFTPAGNDKKMGTFSAGLTFRY